VALRIDVRSPGYRRSRPGDFDSLAVVDAEDEQIRCHETQVPHDALRIDADHSGTEETWTLDLSRDSVEGGIRGSNRYPPPLNSRPGPADTVF
jgi:hypothetical protein